MGAGEGVGRHQEGVVFVKVRHKESGVEADVNDERARALMKRGWERADKPDAEPTKKPATKK